MDYTPLLAHPTLLVVAAFHLIYAFGHFVYEARALSSYFMQYEAPGFAGVVSLLLFPFQLMLQTKYILDHKVNYANWELAVVCVIYLFGFVVFTVSNNQKDSFRRNPYSSTASKSHIILLVSRHKCHLCNTFFFNTYPVFQRFFFINTLFVADE